MNLIDYFQEWETVVTEGKQELITERGIGSDLYPAFGVMRSVDRMGMTGVCMDFEARTIPHIPGTTRWLNLCRQVVTMTHADIVLASVEIFLQFAEDGQATEAIEISAASPEDSITIVRPYKYDAGRVVEWMPPMDPTTAGIHSFSAGELEAARKAWSDDNSYASSHSIRYLSGMCKAKWAGTPELLSIFWGN